MNGRSRAGALWLLLCCSALASAAPANLAVSDQIKARQVRLIQDINEKQFANVMATFAPSYQGLDTESGYLTLSKRRQMYKDRFASDDPGTISILETTVRALGPDYAMLHSHLRNDYRGNKPAENWWYTAVYLRTGGTWKVVFEQ